MKTKNLYYATVFKRTNGVKLLILTFFLVICSWPRVFIETFTRKNFGERYFLFSLNLFLASILAAAPFFWSFDDRAFFSVIGKNFSWYAFLVIFIVYSIKRYYEVKREPGVYDLDKFSLSPGVIHPWFRSLNLFGIKPTSRVISIYYEPAVFYLAGIILGALHQPIGYLLTNCSIIYGLSWAAQFYLGDQFIMDTIDEMISNEELVESFVHNAPADETRGFEVYGERPKNMDFRRKVAEAMMEDEPAVDVI